MPPQLSEYQRQLRNEHIRSGDSSIEGLARAMERTPWCRMQRYRQKQQISRCISSLSNSGGRDRPLSQPIAEALIKYHCDKPDLYLNEMAWFIWDEFHVIVSTSTLSRALNHGGWSEMQVKYNPLLHKCWYLFI